MDRRCDSGRRINRRQQGDLGEASAIEWFTRLGATVLLPVGHSPHFDLVIELEARLLRVQVKSTTQRVTTASGEEREVVAVATRGGNRSWSGQSKCFDPARVDLLFVLTGSGRRWVIPADAVEGLTALSLGGAKYSEFEIEPAPPIRQLVYGKDPLLNSTPALGEYPSGQRMATVNRPAQPSEVRILSPPLPHRESGFKLTKYERKLGRSGQTQINEKRKVTLPQQPVIEAGLRVGDRLRVRSHGHGRVVLELVDLHRQVAA